MILRPGMALLLTAGLLAACSNAKPNPTDPAYSGRDSPNASGDMPGGSVLGDSSLVFVILPGGASQLAPNYTLFGEVVSGMSVVDKIGSFGSSGETGTPTVKVYLLKVNVIEIKS